MERSSSQVQLNFDAAIKSNDVQDDNDTSVKLGLKCGEVKVLCTFGSKGSLT